MKRFWAALRLFFAFVLSVQFLLMVSPPAAMAQGTPAAVTPSGICTKDINTCSNAGHCACPGEYEYDPILGYCLIDDIDDATSRGAPVRSICSIQAELFTTCTDEENHLGYPVKCLCPGTTAYNQLIGQCVVSFR